MGEAYFYHMTRTPLEATLPVLLGKALGAGWRVAVRGRGAPLMDQLDAKLWMAPGDGFLPHGRAGGPHDADQPILLTVGDEVPNGATCLVSVDGAEVSPEEVAAMERVMILFDGNNDDAVVRAREQWRVVTKGGAVAKYWSQETGNWALKASSG
ncbi:MAG TPA: DNA polymerase III subunit chi [Maritimibacter sp.]|nr:DNA polymerase III subunit chi [Maritimibacter sp.]